MDDSTNRSVESQFGGPEHDDRFEGLEALDRLRNDDALARQEALTQRDAIPRFDGATMAPTLEQLDRIREGAFAQFVPVGNDVSFELSPADDPEGANTFGLVGSSVRLDGEQVIPGILALRFDAKNVGAVAPETLRLFRTVGRRRLDPVPLSGVDVDGGFVWGFVTMPGHYRLFALRWGAAGS
jgi:hypothetical protein